MARLPDEPEGYQGWTNYETWAVKLWIDNEEYPYRYWRDQARDAWRTARADKHSTRMERAQLDLADRLRDDTVDNMPDVSGVYSDLLSTALGSVNWHEIAAAMLDDEDLTDEDLTDEDLTDEDLTDNGGA